MKKLFSYLVVFILFSVGILYGGEGMKIKKVLEKCPDSPNCVVSLEELREDSHYIEPIFFKEETSREVKEKLLETIEKLGGKIMEEEEDYVKAQFSSKVFRFKDITQFVIQTEKNMIMVRSEAETGWSDFGVNRKRMEKIREEFSK
ncbi:MAG: DUF1499 domain-containing protein [Fusobacteriaceae bacterium]